MGESRLLIETMDGVGLLTFCGGDSRNVVTEPVWRALAEAVPRLDADAEIGVLVLTGAGHLAFATDLPDPDGAYRRHGPPAADQAGRDACARLLACGKPVVARLRGECIGGGLVIALCADIRIAAADTGFAITAERAAALDAEQLLAEVVGSAQARYLLLAGERIEAPEALRIGLVSRVVPDADLSDTVVDLARQLADSDAETMRACKQAIARPTR